MTAPDRAAARASAPRARSPAPGVHVRPLVEADLSPVWELMREFAVFERLEHEFTGSPEALGRHLLHGQWPPLDAFVVEVDGAIGGFAIAYGVFSTFWTHPILWLEDLFVADRFRGRGAGRALFAAVAALGHQRGCARLDWAVLEWNQPAIEFYERLGAHRAGGWFTYRIPGEGLERFANEVASRRE
jgi:GNAT superfamily N-acetyltransferase